MLIEKLYTELREADNNSEHLVISKVFKAVLGRKVRRNEWGFLRRLIKLYGSETVFWALVSSASINAEGTPLKYVATVCRNMTREDLEEVPPEASNQEIAELLDYMRNYKKPDWEKKLNASD